MIKRSIESTLKAYQKGFPVVCLTGPRQSGKTTLVRHVFSDYDYVTLETPSTLERAIDDPIRFLTQHKTGLIIDEAQKCPELFSYLQEIVDNRQVMGAYVLTGSQNFSLIASITQSLAGRAGILHLLPFTSNEIPLAPDQLNLAIIKGFYPPLFDRTVKPFDWYSSYTRTYLERDVRRVLNIKNTLKFFRFLKLCAGRCGQLINYMDFANAVGVSHPTIKAWLSILETRFITYRLNPYHKNYQKRITKQSKLYFYDTGLLCSLLGITDETILDTHPLRGAIFETFIISNRIKHNMHQQAPHSYYFWRDHHGTEVDLLIETPKGLYALDIKSSFTLKKEQLRTLNLLKKYAKDDIYKQSLIYGGSETHQWGDVSILPWFVNDSI